MPTNSELLDIIVRAKDEASKKIKDVDDSIVKLDKTVKRTGPGLAKLKSGLSAVAGAAFTLKGLVAGIGFGALAGSFLQAATAAENTKVRLNRLLGSVEEGNKLFDSMSKYASGVAFSYQEIMGAATNLAGVMENGRQDVEKWIPIIGDVAAASGLGIQETTSQIIRMYSAGAASADLFRERGVLAMLGFQSGVSYSAEQTRKKLIEMYEDPQSRFRGAAADLANTWGGIMSMIGDAWFQFRNQVMNDEVFDFLKASLAAVLEEIQKFRESGEMAKAAAALADYMMDSMKTIVRGAALVSDAFRGWKLIFLGLRSLWYLFAEGVNSWLAYGYDALGNFAIKLGEIIETMYDAIRPIARLFGTLPDDMAAFGQKFGQAMQKAGEFSKAFADNAKKGADEYFRLGIATTNQINELAKQGTALEKANNLIARIENRAKEIAKAFKEGTGAARGLAKRVKEASATAVASSQLTRLKADTALALREIQGLYKRGEIDIDEYYKRRLEKTRNLLAKEIALEEEKLRATSQPDKQLQIQDRIYSIKKRYAEQELALEQEKEAKKKDLKEKLLDAEKNLNDARLRAEQVFQDQKARIDTRDTGDSGLNEEFRQERIDLMQKQQEDIAIVQEFHREQLALMKARGDDEILLTQTKEEQKAQILDLMRQQQLEKEQQAADQHKRILEMKMEAVADIAGKSSQIFSDLYELTGKKQKEFFYLAKAASIAEATINIAQAITKVLGQGGIFGIAQAVAISAMGAVQIAKIASQSLAEGGVVGGYSPHAKADNIKANLTAGEFVQPVATVKEYGADAMEAIRQKIVPRDALRSALGLSAIRAIPSFGYKTGYAEGGEVASASMGPSEDGGRKSKESTAIVNVLDPSVFDQWSATSAGQNRIMNVISDNIFQVRNMVFDNQN
jgi:ABC-type transporter Mla subunit MlaD